jgi:cell division protein FtsX
LRLGGGDVVEVTVIVGVDMEVVVSSEAVVIVLSTVTSDNVAVCVIMVDDSAEDEAAEDDTEELTRDAGPEDVEVLSIADGVDEVIKELDDEVKVIAELDAEADRASLLVESDDTVDLGEMLELLGGIDSAVLVNEMVEEVEDAFDAVDVLDEMETVKARVDETTLEDKELHFPNPAWHFAPQ